VPGGYSRWLAQQLSENGRRVHSEGQPNPYPDPSRSLDRNLAGLETNTQAGVHTFETRNPARQFQGGFLLNRPDRASLL
jgi:hypothetical protein